MSSFGVNLKNLRINRKLKQSDMANLLSISVRNYQYYEYDERRPELDVLIFLADYFNVSLDYLVGRTSDPKIHKPLKKDGQN